MKKIILGLPDILTSVLCDPGSIFHTVASPTNPNMGYLFVGESAYPKTSHLTNFPSSRALGNSHDYKSQM